MRHQEIRGSAAAQALIIKQAARTACVAALCCPQTKGSQILERSLRCPCLSHPAGSVAAGHNDAASSASLVMAQAAHCLLWCRVSLPMLGALLLRALV